MTWTSPGSRPTPDRCSAGRRSRWPIRTAAGVPACRRWSRHRRARSAPTPNLGLVQNTLHRVADEGTVVVGPDENRDSWSLAHRGTSRSDSMDTIAFARVSPGQEHLTPAPRSARQPRARQGDQSHPQTSSRQEPARVPADLSPRRGAGLFGGPNRAATLATAAPSMPLRESPLSAPRSRCAMAYRS